MSATADAGPESAVPQEEPVALTHRQVMIVLGGLLVGLLLAALDQTIVATALPTIVGDLGGVDQLSWVVTAYLLASTASMPLYGKISDLLGRKRVFQAAIVVFLVGSVLCGAAQNMAQLVLFRGVQGLGGGGLMSLTFTILGDIVPPRQRGRYTGYLTGTFALASVAGPILGGFFVDQVSWRWVFYVNLPIGIAALVATSSALRLPFPRRQASVDLVGAALLVGAVVAALLVAVWGGQDYAWTSGVVVGLGVAAVVLTAAFLAWERRTPEPIVPLRLFSDSVFSLATAIGVCVGSALFGATVFLPLFLQLVTGASATNSGLLLLPIMAGVLTMSIVAGRVISRTGHYRVWPIVGLSFATTGMALLSQMGSGTGRLYSSASMLLVGAGIGMTMPTLTLAAQNSVPVADLGVATSVLSFFRTLGSTLGVAVFGAVLTVRLDAELARLLPAGADRLDSSSLASSPEAVAALDGPTRDAVVEAMARAIPTVFFVATPVLALAFVLAWLVRELPLRDTASVSSVGGAEAAEAPAEDPREFHAPAAAG